MVASLTGRATNLHKALRAGGQPNFFDLLHVRPAQGRWFLPDEDRVAGRDAVVVLAYETWSEFGGDPGIVGSEIRISGRAFTVVGVAPEGFTGADHFVMAAFYVPLAMLQTLNTDASPRILEQRDRRTFRVIGRLKPEASLEQARLEVERIAGALQQEYPATNERHGFLMRREMDARFSEYSPVAALGVILIGLAIAVLLVARQRRWAAHEPRAGAGTRDRVAARHRRQPRAVDASDDHGEHLNRGHGRIGRSRPWLRRNPFIPAVPDRQRCPREIGIRADQRALVVGLVVAAISALLSSVIPAWRSTRSRDLTTALRNTTSPASRTARLWGRHGLVASQIALTLALLTVALSFYRAFEAEYGRGPDSGPITSCSRILDPSFARVRPTPKRHVLSTPEGSRGSDSRRDIGRADIVCALNQDGGGSVGIVPEGVVLPPGVESLNVTAARVDDAYFDTIGIAIISGRAFRVNDTPDAPRVAIVSRGMARAPRPGDDPIGKRIRVTSQDGAFAEVVGVAEDTKFRLFTATSTPFLHLPRLQNPSTRSTLVVRTETESAAIAGEMRAAISETDRDVPILSMRTMEAFYYANAKNLNTVVVRTIALMGIMGLALALVGLRPDGVRRQPQNARDRNSDGNGRAANIGPSDDPASGFAAVFHRYRCRGRCQRRSGRSHSGAFPGTGGDAVTYLTIVPVVLMVVALAAYIPARRAPVSIR